MNLRSLNTKDIDHPAWSIAMRKAPIFGIIGGALAAGTALLAYERFVRPWHLRWGATDEELVEELPGDEVKPGAALNVTHAITIDAPPDVAWKWLVQIGQDRGGFFSYDWIENMFGLEVHNAEALVPEYQNLKIGDFVRSAHRGWLGGRFDEIAGWYVVTLEPNRTLVLRDEIAHGSWSFILRPLPGDKTRLLIRARADRPESVGSKLFYYSFWEPAHFIMERKMLLTLKEKAEATAHPPRTSELEAVATC
jgi:hypothetical protein